MSSKDPQLQEGMRNSRKSLKQLQHTAADRENLVGRPPKSLKHHISQESPVDTGEVKRKNLSTKETQANLDAQISADDLTNPGGASEKYWEILAKKRLVALQDALEENEKSQKTIEDLLEENAKENEKSQKIIEDLLEENTKLKQMLDEANSFVEVIKEELANGSNNDTGIDVNDVSTADETVDEDAPTSTKNEN